MRCSGRGLDLSPELLAALETYRSARGLDAISARYDAFLLDSGLGSAKYLTRDGRIVWDDEVWEVEGTYLDALAAISIGARKSGISLLLQLLPVRPHTATDCVNCAASGRVVLPHSDKASTFHITCWQCGGLGWQCRTVDLAASVLSLGERQPRVTW